MGFSYYQPPAGGGGGSDDQTASEVPFTPANGAQWSDPDPDNVADALDDLALPSAILLGALTDPSADDGDRLVYNAGSLEWQPAAETSIANTGSYQLDGTDDSMSIANASSPNLTLTGDFTIEAWVYIPAVTGDNTICSRWEESSDASKNYTFLTDGNQRLELRLWDSVGGFQVIYTSDVLDIENVGWIHVAVTFDVSTDTAVFYLNGTAVTSDTAVIDTIQSGTADFVVGAEQGGGDLFEGHINMLRVWDDIRTATEINASMYSIIGAAGDDLIAEWAFNGDADDPISSYDLTISGATPVAFVPWRV